MAVALGEDQKQRNRRVEAELIRSAAIALATVPVVVVVLVLAVLLVVGAGALIAVLVAVVVLLAVGAGLALWALARLRAFGDAFVTGLGATPLPEEAQPRLHNVVEGLCVAHGLVKPAILGIEGPGANSATVTLGWGSTATNALVVSTPLLASLSRIELEGVVARQLSQFLDGSASLGSLVATLGSTAPFGSILGGRLATAIDTDQPVLADLEGVRMTRYPPGLAAALDTIGAASTEIATADADTAHLWLADPLGSRSVPAPTDGPTPASIDVRSATLREL